MEEYEKGDSRVPKWKVEWVRNNLEDMIGKEDKDAPIKKSPTRKKSLASKKSKSK